MSDITPFSHLSCSSSTLPRNKSVKCHVLGSVHLIPGIFSRRFSCLCLKSSSALCSSPGISHPINSLNFAIMQTYAILQFLEDQHAWQIRFLGYEIYSTAWITNAGVVHLWAGNTIELQHHTKKVATFHNFRLINPVPHELFQEIYEWIEAFLNGSKLSPPISLFSLRFFPMYRKILEVPYGTVVHYSQLAKSFPDRMKLIKGLKYNPFPPLIPCHRIVPKNSFPGQYTPLGEKFKLQLIQKEITKQFRW